MGACCWRSLSGLSAHCLRTHNPPPPLWIERRTIFPPDPPPPSTPIHTPRPTPRTTPHRTAPHCTAGEQTPDGPVPEWRITDIVSQTDVLRCLAVHLDSGGSLDDDAFDWPLSRLGLVTGDVATVTGSTPTLSGALGGGGGQARVRGRLQGSVGISRLWL